MREWRALNVCAVVHVVTHSLSARGEIAHRSPSAERGRKPHPNPEGRHAPTARELYTAHTCLTSIDLPRRRSTEDPGAPLLSAVCVSPSSQRPPGSGAAKSKKKNSGDARQVENYGRQVPKLHTANLSTWRTLRNSENAAKNGQKTKIQRNRWKSDLELGLVGRDRS